MLTTIDAHGVIAAIFPEEWPDIAAIFVSLNVIVVLLLLVGVRGLRDVIESRRKVERRMTNEEGGPHHE